MYQTKALLATTALCAVATTSTQADIIYTFEQVGGNVVMTVSGSLDLTDLTESNFSGSFGADTRAVINGTGTRRRIEIGSADVNVNIFSGLTEQNALFAPGSGAIAGTNNSHTSNSTGIYVEGEDGEIFIDDDLNPGDVLTVNSVSTFAGVTLADFGLTAGTNQLWLENENVSSNGSVFVNVIPEPGSLALMGLGGLCVLRRRRG